MGHLLGAPSLFWVVVGGTPELDSCVPDLGLSAQGGSSLRLETAQTPCWQQYARACMHVDPKCTCTCFPVPFVASFSHALARHARTFGPGAKPVYVPLWLLVLLYFIDCFRVLVKIWLIEVL